MRRSAREGALPCIPLLYCDERRVEEPQHERQQPGKQHQPAPTVNQHRRAANEEHEGEERHRTDRENRHRGSALLPVTLAHLCCQYTSQLLVRLVDHSRAREPVQLPRLPPRTARLLPLPDRIEADALGLIPENASPRKPDDAERKRIKREPQRCQLDKDCQRDRREKHQPLGLDEDLTVPAVAPPLDLPHERRHGKAPCIHTQRNEPPRHLPVEPPDDEQCCKIDEERRYKPVIERQRQDQRIGPRPLPGAASPHPRPVQQLDGQLLAEP